VEGAGAKNPLLQRGYSRDHRPDCLQLVIALIVNREGFPLSYEVFDGNRADVTTVEVILRTVERKYGQARRVWVMDRGLVSEANLQAIRRRGGCYLVGTPRSQLKQFEADLLKDDWLQVQPDVEIKRVGIAVGKETYLLCRTRGRREKENAIRSRFAARLEKTLTRLQKSVAEGRLKNRDTIHLRLGRLQARYPQVADLYQMTVQERDARLEVRWALKPGRQAWRQAREGAYLLRTNLPAGDPSQLWTQYTQLTEVEAAFRALKSELSIRPLFHQREGRVKAHVLVAFLGYALWVTLKHLLRRPGSELSPSKALGLLSTLNSADIVLPTTDGREIRLRRITEPTEEQKRLLHQLRITLPEHLEIDLKCSVDSAIA
jgi:transposase